MSRRVNERLGRSHSSHESRAVSIMPDAAEYLIIRGHKLICGKTSVENKRLTGGNDRHQVVDDTGPVGKTLGEEMDVAFAKLRSTMCFAVIDEPCVWLEAEVLVVREDDSFVEHVAEVFLHPLKFVVQRGGVIPWRGAQDVAVEQLAQGFHCLGGTLYGLHALEYARNVVVMRLALAVVGILGEHLGRRGVNPALKIHKHVVHVKIKNRLFHSRRFFVCH